MKLFMKLVGFSILVLSLVCLGCGSADTETSDDPASRPYSENLNEVVEVFEEMVFCTVEGAGVETLAPLRERMMIVLNGLPASIQQSALSSSDQAKLAKSIEEATVACQKAGLDSESAFQTLCKDLENPLASIKKFCSP